jgi:hypothetical protein
MKVAKKPVVRPKRIKMATPEYVRKATANEKHSISPEELSIKKAITTLKKEDKKVVKNPTTGILVTLCIIQTLLVGAVGFIGYSLYTQKASDVQVDVTCENPVQKPVWSSAPVKKSWKK